MWELFRFDLFFIAAGALWSEVIPTTDNISTSSNRQIK